MIITKLNRIILYSKPLNDIQMSLIEIHLDNIINHIVEFIGKATELSSIKIDTVNPNATTATQSCGTIINVNNSFIVGECETINKLLACNLLTVDDKKESMQISHQ